MKRQITIGEIAEINANSLTQKDMFQEIMYLDTGNITRNEIDNIQVLNVMMDKIPSRAKRKVKDKTIIYSTVRPNQEHYGFLENPGDNFIISTGFSTIDVYDENTDEKFIYYLLTQKHITDYLHTIGENSVSSYPSINPDDIANLKFAVPDLKTQQSIAAVLSALDKKIALNKQINARLEEMAKTLYDYWFVQFDFPDANGKPYKSSGGEMVFDETLKREIPKGWEVKSLWKIAKYFNGLALQKYRPENELDDFLPVIKIREMNEGVSSNTERAKTNIPKEAIIDDGDILFSWSATLEIKIWSQGKGALNQHIFKVTSSEYPKYFFYFELLNYLKHLKMIAYLRKTTMGHITQDHLKQAYICIPSQPLLEKLEKIVTPIFQKMLITQKQNHQLTQLRDFLLPMLMNGQVSVAE